jgi:hypothetical protein
MTASRLGQPTARRSSTTTTSPRPTSSTQTEAAASGISQTAPSPARHRTATGPSLRQQQQRPLPRPPRRNWPATDHTPGATDFNPNWSPSENDLVFLRDTTGLNNDIFTVHTSGASLVRLTNTPNRVEFGPVWSPDGTNIAFSGCLNISTTPDCEIYTMNPDGSSETQITTFGIDVGVAAIDWQPIP